VFEPMTGRPAGADARAARCPVRPRAQPSDAGHSGPMHGDGLPNVLSAVSIALTMVVIFFAWRTVAEAKRATAEERKTVGELTKLLDAVCQLRASSEVALKAAERTVELAAEARNAEQRNSQVALLRQLLKIVEEIQSAAGQESTKLVRAGFGDLSSWDSSWKCPQQHDLEAALKGVSGGTDLPMCRILTAPRGADKVGFAATAAGVELQDTLRAFGVSPRE
jgi:hypothetical protein